MTRLPDSASLLSPVWSHLSQIVVERGEGCYLYDGNGTRYLDFTSGIGVTNTGHSHPRVVRAIQEQAAKLLHGQINIVYSAAVVELAEALRQIMPSHLDSYFFSNSGAEAIEGAIKLARQTSKRQNVIVFQGSFHGRTSLAMAMTTSKTIYRVGYQPLPGGIFVAPFPYAYYYGWDEGSTVDYCLAELNHLLKTQTAPEETAAMIVEPVLGEGGYVPAPQGFLQGLREICDANGILLIVDEVQTGFGRTGRFFAFEDAGIKPDIVVMAKGLGSGMPISAIAAPQALMSRWQTGSHGGTYGGNPVAAAAAVATIHTLRDEGLIENAQARGEQLTNGLRDLQAEFPVLGDVRGPGLMIGVEFGRSGREPLPDLAKAVQQACLDRQLLLLTCGAYGNTVRWIPPLVAGEEQIADALSIFGDSVAQAAGKMGS
ncbi:MAG TPA: aminotransferase class III-fold pyridoxal phosphate-dependent enzyme [Promineifilum sp.]